MWVIKKKKKIMCVKGTLVFFFFLDFWKANSDIYIYRERERERLEQKIEHIHADKKTK